MHSLGGRAGPLGLESLYICKLGADTKFQNHRTTSSLRKVNTREYRELERGGRGGREEKNTDTFCLQCLRTNVWQISLEICSVDNQ